MAISDRIFRFPNASFKATKKVEMKYISTMPKMSTYFLVPSLENNSLRKSCLICWFFCIWRPSSTESCRFEIIARLKFTQLAKIILTRPPKLQPRHMAGVSKLYYCRVETRNDKNDGILNKVPMQQNYTDAGIIEADASPNVYMKPSSFTKPPF